MKKKRKYYGLIIGLCLVFLSFLFYARAQGSYALMLIGGLLLSSVFYLIVLFGQNHWKNKLVWTLVIIGSIVILQVTEPFLIKSSYLIYLNLNKAELEEACEILSNKENDISIRHNDISIIHNDITDHKEILSTSEKSRLEELRKNLDVYFILKKDKEIHFGLFGFLDVRLGIYYSKNSKKPKRKSRELKELSNHWYY